MTQHKYSDLVMGSAKSDSPLALDFENCTVVTEPSYQKPTLMDEVEEAVRKIDNVVSSNLYLMPQNAVYGWLNARKDILLAVGKGGNEDG
jgi:hypothetical protein